MARADRLWTLGYLLLAGLIVLCAVVAVRRSAGDRGRAGGRARMAPRRRRRPRPSPDAPLRRPSAGACYWVALAFAPSSLLLGVTTYVTTDIAALPLLWVLPLAIYLLSFILAFGRWPPAFHRVVAAATLPLVLLVMFFMISALPAADLGDGALALPAALRRLPRLPRRARRSAGPRPGSSRSSTCSSPWAACSADRQRAVAPLVFNSLLEYPLAMALAVALVAGPGASGRRRRGARSPLDVGLLARAVVLALSSTRRASRFTSTPPSSSGVRHRRDVVTTGSTRPSGSLNRLLTYGLRSCVRLPVRRRPLPLGAALAGAARRGGLRRRPQQRGDPAGAQLLRRAPGHARPRHQGLHGAAPRRRRCTGGRPMTRSAAASPWRTTIARRPVGHLFAELDRRPAPGASR